MKTTEITRSIHTDHSFMKRSLRTAFALMLTCMLSMSNVITAFAHVYLEDKGAHRRYQFEKSIEVFKKLFPTFMLLTLVVVAAELLIMHLFTKFKVNKRNAIVITVTNLLVMLARCYIYSSELAYFIVFEMVLLFEIVFLAIKTVIYGLLLTPQTAEKAIGFAVFAGAVSYIVFISLYSVLS